MCECTAAGIQWEEIGKKNDIFEENISLFFLSLLLLYGLPHSKMSFFPQVIKFPLKV